MSTEPEALRLAEYLEANYSRAEEAPELLAAAELRRLHALNAELLEALRALFVDYKSLADSGDAGNWALEDQDVGKQALAAIAKAEGANG